MRTKILLATTVLWPSAARLAGAFANLGAQVEAVFPAKHPFKASRYLARAYRYRPLDAVNSFIAAIEAANPDRIIPCDDRALGLLLQLKQFAPLLERSLGPLSGYDVLTARALSIAAAREEGIRAPLTLAVPDDSALPDALAEVGLPCVMKVDGSWGGEGVKIVRSEAEAKRAFAALEGPPGRLRSLARAVLRNDAHFILDARYPAKARVSLQAFVDGKPATSVFAARAGRVLAALHMDVLSWGGDCGPASVMARIDCPAMDEAAVKLAARFQLNGLIGLDFIRDHEGQPHLIEINPRATQICHLPLFVDLPAALLGTGPRVPLTKRQIALFPQLLSAASLPEGVHRDIPWDDPGVLQHVAGDVLPETDGLAMAAEFMRPGEAPPIFRKTA